jgi:hypothetical protein
MKKEIVILAILSLFISCNLKSQDTIMKVNNLEIISSDSLALKKYNWSKYVVNNKDTIIVLSDKKLIYNCIKRPVIKLEKINSISDDIGYRFYFNDLYIDGILYFPKEINVYLYGCSGDNEFISKFEEKKLPIYLDTEDYNVYNLFDNKAIIECSDLEILHESCKNHSVFKYGYILASNEMYNLLLYYQDVSEDTLYYKLVTLNSKNEIISSINIMEYCGDGTTVNGRILNNFDIYTVQREILSESVDENNKIKVKEIETKYLIEKNGEIKQVSRTSPLIKYYKVGSQGEFIPTQ